MMGAGPFTLDRACSGQHRRLCPAPGPFGRPCASPVSPAASPGLFGWHCGLWIAAAPAEPGARGILHFEPDSTRAARISASLPRLPGMIAALPPTLASRAGGGVGHGAVYAKRRTAARLPCADRPPSCRRAMISFTGCCYWPCLCCADQDRSRSSTHADLRIASTHRPSPCAAFHSLKSAGRRS